mgnify:CR=1 FL=1
MASKNIILRKKVEDQIIDLYIKTIASQVDAIYRSETKDLNSVLAAIAGEIDLKAATTDVDALKKRLDTYFEGDLDASLDTLKELQDYLHTHEEAYQALVKIANGKVDAVEGKSLISDELITKITDLYTKADLDKKLEAMVTATTEAKSVADAAKTAAETNATSIAKNTENITKNVEAITALQNTVAANGKVILSSTVPDDLTENDLLLFEVPNPTTGEGTEETV